MTADSDKPEIGRQTESLACASLLCKSPNDTCGQSCHKRASGVGTRLPMPKAPSFFRSWKLNNAAHFILYSSRLGRSSGARSGRLGTSSPSRDPAGGSGGNIPWLKASKPSSVLIFSAAAEAVDPFALLAAAFLRNTGFVSAWAALSRKGTCEWLLDDTKYRALQSIQYNHVLPSVCEALGVGRTQGGWLVFRESLLV